MDHTSIHENLTTDEEHRVNGNIVARMCGRPDLIELPGSPLGAEPLDKPARHPKDCIFCGGLRTARKRGINHLRNGSEQQYWNCRQCGKNWQTTPDGKIVAPPGKGLVDMLIGMRCDITPEELVLVGVERGVIPGILYCGQDGIWYYVEPGRKL